MKKFVFHSILLLVIAFITTGSLSATTPPGLERVARISHRIGKNEAVPRVK